ncbi:MAG: threonylcarbamoyl-AMP synthase [Flavobacteriales bacterium]|nr:threonylcarbamoyl-AMP synthase [Flavobacteriales bacterium]|tara:strand:+ start:153 stop:731 length:579 start_codon:yes stop_codon:yes gene_type:complete
MESKSSEHTETQQALSVLREGGIILYPTDTVWGIGCDASNAEAVKKVYDLKNRLDSKALITLVASEVMLERTVIDMPDIAWDLIDAAEKPLTIIFQEVKGIAHNAIAEDGSCAIRLPKDNFCQQLIQRFGKPLISTSANTSGIPTPQSFQDIEPSILSGVDYVVNLRQQEECKNTPSSIIFLKNNGEIKIIR